jgi:hypothetical protein
MIEYGVRNPDVMIGAHGGQIGGKAPTYVTDIQRTIATPGVWFPFHPVARRTQSGGLSAAKINFR